MTKRGLSRRIALTAGLTAASSGIALAASTGEGRSKAKPKARSRAFQMGHADAGGALIKLIERPTPVPAHGEVLLKVHATAMNARDLTYAQFGGFPDKPPVPTIPLADNAGVIVAVGPGVTDFAVGDKVMAVHYALWTDGRWNQSLQKHDLGRTHDGFLAEMALAPASSLVRLPTSLSYEEAATLPTAGLTAWRALVECTHLRPGNTVLTLGTGGVSVFALQIAKLMGMRVVITSSSDDKLARMRKLGADIVINYKTSPNWEKDVIAATNGEGVNLVLNNVGQSEVGRCLASCASGGTMIVIGGKRSEVAVDTLKPSVPRNLTITAISNGSRRMAEDFVVAIDHLKLKPVIDKVFSFEDAPAAYALMMGSDRIGKIVIRIV